MPSTKERVTSELTKTQGNGTGNSRLFVTAVILARKGRYKDALNILSRALESDNCTQADALELQARIYAQKGLYTQSEACWLQAKKLGKQDDLFEESLRQLKEFRRPCRRALKIITGGVAGVLFVLLAFYAIIVTPIILHQLKIQHATITELQAIMDTAYATSGGTNDSPVKNNTISNSNKLNISRKQSPVYSFRNDHESVKLVLASQKRILDSLLPLFQSLRPKNADQLHTRLQNLTQQHTELQRLVAKYEKHNLVPFRLHNTRQKLMECEKQLKSCKTEYEATVVPWRESIKFLRSSTMAVREASFATSKPVEEKRPK